MRRLHWTTILGLVAVWTTPASAQDITFGGQIRPRYEYRDPATGGTRDAFTSMRVRANLTAVLDRQVRVFIQVQDVRLFGEEENTLTDFSADNLDLHQGYIEIEAPTKQALRLRVGREELNLGGQRLVGAVGWTQQGRSFDGARVVAGAGNAAVNLFGYRLQQETAPTHDRDAVLVGAYGVIGTGSGAVEPYVVYNKTEGVPETDQGTLGVRVHGARSSIRYRVEGSLQVGTRSGQDVTAFMLGVRIGTAVANGLGSVTFWYDYLSGDNDPADGEIKVFDTLFATNHKFYGFADLFLNIPAHTAGLGLQDVAVKGSIRPRDDFTANLDIHSFRTARRGTLTTKHLGEEIDLTFVHRYSTNLQASAGLAYIFQADGFSQIGRLSENMVWTYIMLNATF